MKNECSIIQDILPLYVEEMASDDTVSFVREHLKDCPRCRAELEKLQKPVEVQLKPDINAAPLKRLKKALLMKKATDYSVYCGYFAGTDAGSHLASYCAGVF